MKVTFGMPLRTTRDPNNLKQSREYECERTAPIEENSTEYAEAVAEVCETA
jgi:hypothetical protein